MQSIYIKYVFGLQVTCELDDSDYRCDVTFDDDDEMDPDFLPSSFRGKRKTTVCSVTTIRFIFC